MRPGHGSSHRPAMRRNSTILIAAAALVLASMDVADGQQTTEQFIPIGQSPGLSGVVTYVGEIVAVNPAAGSLTMRRSGDADAVAVSVVDDTRIWLDRSSSGLPNVTGTFADLTVGSVAEIHFRDPDERRSAAWIKVRSDRPG